MANDGDCEEDVVIEGSDLYNALKQLGSPEFESTPVNIKKFPDDWEDLDKSTDETPPTRYPRLLNVYTTIRNYIWSNQPSKNPPKRPSGVEELKIILTLEPLLDDHASFVQDILKDYPPPKTSTYFTTFSASVLIGASLISPNSRIPSLVIAASISTLKIYQRYSHLSSLKDLSNLVLTQNDIFHLQKKSLRILRDFLTPKRLGKFTDLEVSRLKHIQRLLEVLCRTIERCSKIFQKASNSLVGLLPVSMGSQNLITKFDEAMELQGEITYKKLEQFYYSYIIAQSDMMNLLAIIYSDDSRSSQLKLSRIVNEVCRSLKFHQEKLRGVFGEYESSRRVDIPRNPAAITVLKFRDLYMHVDLLSRRLRAAYGMVSSILEDIENNCAPEREELVDSLVLKMTEVYKDVDTARDFAEFNILVMKKLKGNREQQVRANWAPDFVESERPVVFDADPQIIDECFEEYIKSEYLRPLCEDDDGSLERAKMDKLLEKNFMSELKGVLVDKYRSMSEREARALLRYRKSAGEVDELVIPPPPPLPTPRPDLSSSGIKENRSRNRRPVPLPRTINHAAIPQDEEIVDTSERLSIKLPFGGKIPAFTRDEETFVGSGENSEEEIAGSGCEDDEMSQ